MKYELHLEGIELFNAQIELLIKILAHQQAMAGIIIEMLAKSDEEVDQFISQLNADYAKYIKSNLQSLSERRGKIDLNDILGNE